MQSRHWCFTLNHPEELIDWNLVSRVKYAIYQHEIGEEGTDHFQGYVEFSGPMRMAALKEILPTAHWEPRRGSRQQAMEYCRKEETRIDGPYEYGTPPAGGQGTRNDLRALTESIKTGKTETEIFVAHPNEYYKYRKNILSARVLFTVPRNAKSDVWYIFGPTGTGKSRTALERWPGAYWKPPGNLWWDGYDNHATVILDEFYGWFRFDYLLRLLDRYPLLVEVKGGMVPFVATTIVITSNKLPSQWYGKRCGPHLPALYRRIDHWCSKMDGGELMEHLDMDTFELYVNKPLDLPGSPVSDAEGYEKYPKLYSEDDYM